MAKPISEKQKENPEIDEMFNVRCTICGSVTDTRNITESVANPNMYANVAIRLICNHWMLDDCDEDFIENGSCMRRI